MANAPAGIRCDAAATSAGPLHCCASSLCNHNSYGDLLRPALQLIALRAIRDKFVRGAAHVVATELVLLVPFGLADLSSRIRFLVAFSG